LVAKAFENAADIELQKAESAELFAKTATPEDFALMDLIEQNMDLFTDTKPENEEQAITTMNLHNILTLQTIELIASIMIKSLSNESMARLIPSSMRSEDNSKKFEKYGSPSLAKICTL
jgi:hypothetical protein